MKYQWAQIFRSLVPYWPTHLSVWLYYPPLTRRLTAFLDHYYFAQNFGFLVAQVLVFDGGVNFDEMTHVFKWFLLTKVPTNPNYHNCRAQKDQKVLLQTTFRNRMNLKNQFLNGTEWISRFSCSNFSLIFFLLSLFILFEAKKIETIEIPLQWYQSNAYDKVGCAFPMVSSSDFRMGKHRDDHEKDAPHFKRFGSRIEFSAIFQILQSPL